MAQTKVRGVTIEIGGDTSGLKDSLTQVNSEVRATQKALKDVEKLLKIDPGNTELLAQKQKLLSERVEETTTKLETLKEAQKQFIEEGGDVNSSGYMALEREIESTKLYLKDAREEMENFNVTLETAKAKFDEVGTKAQDVADKTKALSIAGGAVVTAFGAMAYNAVTLSDDLNTLANQSGLTTEEIQKFQYAADIVDVSTETITGALTKMRRNMDSTSSSVQEAWATIGVATRNADGSLRDSTEVFYDALEALSKVGNETERDVLAMQLFGKSADQLAGIIDDGGAALKELGDEAENLGIIMDQETLDSLNQINDQIDRLKAQFTGELAVAGAKAMEALTPVFEVVVKGISKILEFIGELSSEQIGLIVGISAVVASISPIAGIIAKISNAVSTVIGLVPKITKAFSAISAFAAANPILLIAAAVSALAILIIAKWDKIKPVLENIWNKTKEICEKIKDKITEVIDKIKTAIKNFINDAIEKINKVLGLINGIINAINTLTQGLNKVVGTNIGKIGNVSEIPALANGGILSSGSALVGEAGPELLSLVNGEAVVRPLTNNTYNNNVGGATNNYIFKVDDIATYVAIENKLKNERQSLRMGYIGG